jgi:hypothetical protein
MVSQMTMISTLTVTVSGLDIMMNTKARLKRYTEPAGPMLGCPNCEDRQDGLPWSSRDDHHAQAICAFFSGRSSWG